MKINNFRGDLSDITDETATLEGTHRGLIGAEESADAFRLQRLLNAVDNALVRAVSHLQPLLNDVTGGHDSFVDDRRGCACRRGGERTDGVSVHVHQVLCGLVRGEVHRVCGPAQRRYQCCRFSPKYRSGHAKNCLFLLSKKLFTGSKYPKIYLLNFEKTSIPSEQMKRHLRHRYPVNKRLYPMNKR